VDFGNKFIPTGAIFGTKWSDENGDGKRSNNETGLAGWTIYLDQNGNGQPDAGEPSTVTGQNGSYQFINLPDGNYIVREVLQQGWIQTFPRDGAYSIGIDGHAADSIDFGNVEGGGIHGTKWMDLNGDGRRDDNEPGIRGWTIYLDLNGDGRLEQGEPTTVTTDDGSYEFTNLRPSRYTVAEVLVPEWRQTYPGTPREYFDFEEFEQGSTYSNDATFVTVGTLGTEVQVNVTTLAQDGVATIGTGGQAGHAGQELEFHYSVANSQFPRPVDELELHYGVAGTAFVIEVNGERQTFKHFGELNGQALGGTLFTVLETDDERGTLTIDGTINAFAIGGAGLAIDHICVLPSGGMGVHNVDLGSGERYEGLDFGNSPPEGEIHGTKYEDLDGDGRRGRSEPGIPGVQIYLDLNHDGVLNLDESGRPIEPMTTTMLDNPLTDADETGMYWLMGVPAGHYVVREVVPEGQFQTGPEFSFSGPDLYGAGNSAFDVTAADINNDEAIDLIVVDLSAGGVQTLANLGNGQFAPPIYHQVGDDVRAIAAGDLNDDGSIDLVVTLARSGQVAVLINQGNGRFEPPVFYETGNEPIDVVLGDFDRSGDLDVATSNRADDQLVVLPNLGNGTLGDRQPIDVKPLPGGLAAADINLDGHLDLVTVSTQDNLVSVLLNRDDGTFSIDAEFSVASGPMWITAADFDQNGDVDLAISHPSPARVSVLMSEGGVFGPTFADPIELTGGMELPRQLTAGDLDDDEIPDLIVAEGGFNTMHVFLGDVENPMAERLQLETEMPAESVVSEDLNGDGIHDVAFASTHNFDNANISSGFVSVFLRGVRNGYTIDLEPGETIEGLDFGNVRPGQIRGLKFDDFECDGVYEPKLDPGLAGVTIYIDLNHNGEFDEGEPSAITDAAGSYVIQGVPQGTHIVREVLPEGYYPTFPESGFHEVTIIGSGQSAGDVNFGNSEKTPLLDGDDWIYGTEEDDDLHGDNTVDDPCIVLIGGDDHLYGYEGDDTLAGQLADDTYYFFPAPDLDLGNEIDTVIELADAGTEEPTDEGLHDQLNFSALGSDEPVVVDLSGTPPWAIANQIAEHFRVDPDTNTPTSASHLLVTALPEQHRYFEELIGGAADDFLIGNDGNNLFDGGFGSDFMQGGAGNDIYRFVLGNEDDEDTIIETIGIDTIDFSNIDIPVIADLSGMGQPGWTADQVAEYGGRTVESVVPDLFENITGGTNDDELTGNDGPNLLVGGPGLDIINGKRGNDQLVGETEDDQFVFEEDWGTDEVVEEPDGGVDTMDFQAVSDDLTFTVGTNFIVASDGTNFANHTGTDTNHVERLLGGTGNNTLIAADTPNMWIITGENQGTINGVYFKDVENLIGGSDVDTFIFESEGRITGNISSGDGDDVVNLKIGHGVDGTLAGESGNDTLLGQTVYNITGTNSGDIPGLVNAFTNVENLIGGDEIDTFNVGPAGQLSGLADGGLGNDQMSLAANDNSWNITGTDSGHIVGVIGMFKRVPILIGGTGQDTFSLIGGTLTGNIDGGGDIDTLIGDNLATAFVVTGLNTGAATGVGTGFADVENLTGGSLADTFQLSGGTLTGSIDGAGNIDTLIADDLATNFVVTGPNAGTVTGVAAGFADVESLTGGSLNDTFQLSGGTLTGRIDGAGDIDTLIADNLATTFVVTEPNAGTVTGVGAGFADVENLTGGSLDDTFQLSGGTLTGSIDGAGDIDTVIADDLATTFVVTGPNAGTVTGVAAGFADVENLTGGALDDTFQLSGGTLTGSIDGAGDIDTVIADNLATTFVVTGLNTGTVTGVAAGFADVENLTGGSLADTFQLSGGTLTGSIDGAGNIDTVIADNLATTFVVTGLNTGTVTGVAAGFADVENL
ncbi:MAG: hypothetical protein GY768_33290, partial [Planctomycetaceae bacterium]|nr:hypothetical protein [Planctomycetaceae bacterium]